MLEKMPKGLWNPTLKKGDCASDHGAFFFFAWMRHEIQSAYSPPVSSHTVTIIAGTLRGHGNLSPCALCPIEVRLLHIDDIGLIDITTSTQKYTSHIQNGCNTYTQQIISLSIHCLGLNSIMSRLTYMH